MSEALSLELPDAVADRLRDRAAAAEENPGALAQRLVDEGLRMAVHPGIVFRDDRKGRTAALVAGPDVWQVIAAVRSSGGGEVDAVDRAASRLSLNPEQVRVALRYRDEFPAEIDGRIRLHQEAAEEAGAARTSALARLVLEMMKRRYPSAETLRADQVAQVLSDVLIALVRSDEGGSRNDASATYEYRFYRPMKTVGPPDTPPQTRDTALAAVRAVWAQQVELPERLRGLSEEEIAEDVVEAVREVRAELRAEVDARTD